MTLPPDLQRKITQTSTRMHPDLIQVRRELHRHPELSGDESWTAGYLAARLASLGLEVHTGIGGHGLFADLIIDAEKPTVALRVDMDALPIQEINEVPYRSQVPGVMHACGHDVHSAIGLGTASVLKALAPLLPGNVRLIFQPEEEEVTGALRMIRSGVLRNPTPGAIFGLHVAPLPVGQIAWTDGLFLAGFDHYLVSLTPENGQVMPLNYLDVIAQHCCHVIQGFNRWELPETWDKIKAFWENMQENDHDLQHFVIYDASTNLEDPDAWHGQFGLGIKAADPHLRKTAFGRVKAALNRICRTTHTDYHMERVARMPDMLNHAGLVHTVVPALAQAIGEPNLIQLQAAFPFNCEDFAFYTKTVPGAMFWLGGANPDQGKFAILHTPDFDVDEGCLLTGTIAMATVMVEALLKSLEGNKFLKG